MIRGDDGAVTQGIATEDVHAQGKQRPHPWLSYFDRTLHTYFGVTHTDLGADETTLGPYVDLSPEEAAFDFALDYDLDRVDWWTSSFR